MDDDDIFNTNCKLKRKCTLLASNIRIKRLGHKIDYFLKANKIIRIFSRHAPLVSTLSLPCQTMRY
jgi:hypothetical protein